LSQDVETPTIGGLASEGGHWYKRDGEPCYQVIAKGSGLPRDVNLKDARKLGLLPGVSTILNMENKPQLTKWLVDQAYLACLTLPKIEGESLEEFKYRAAKDAGMQAEMARMRGNVLHAEIESYLDGGKLANPESEQWVIPVADWLDRNFGRVAWSTERSFGHELGYGGKVDLHTKDGEHVVIDFKTKAFTEEQSAKKMAWDGHAMQLHAYAHGLGISNARKLNVFISTTVPGLIVGHEWLPDSDYQWDAFQCLLRLWQLRKRYDTRFTK
jgi:hypothetical protein